MNELQSEEVIEDEVTQVDIVEDVIDDETNADIDQDDELEDQEDGAELATDSQGEDEQNASDEQDAVQKRINKLTFEKKQAEREKQQLEERMLKLEQSLKPQEPPTPTTPDPFSDSYEDDLQEYNKALIARHTWETQQQQSVVSKQQAQQQAQQDTLKDIQSKSATYNEKATSFGIKPDQLKLAGETVGAFGISEDVAMAILSDDKGPLITTYLADNHAELDQVSSMTPYQAAIYIETKIKPKLGEVRSKQTTAPAPVRTLKASSVDSDSEKYPMLKGVKYL